MIILNIGWILLICQNGCYDADNLGLDGCDSYWFVCYMYAGIYIDMLLCMVNLVVVVIENELNKTREGVKKS